MTWAFVLVLLLALVLAGSARAIRAPRNARDLFTASGQLGAVLVFFLSIGETYSVATMLGFPGGFYAGGDRFVFWFFGYILLAGPVVYCIGPRIWRAGRHYGAMTVADFFGSHFDSRRLELLVAIYAILLLIPIAISQLLGLKLVFAGLAPGVPMPLVLILASLAVLVLVRLSGLGGTAYVAILKDVLMLTAILGVGFCAFRAWQAPVMTFVQPELARNSQATRFALSTLLLQAFGFLMIPQTWAFMLAARSPAALRKAQVFAPLYLVMYPALMLIAAFAARHHLTVPHQDQVFLVVARQVLPGWAYGVVLASVVLAAVVFLCATCLAIAALVMRNVIPGLDSAAQLRWSSGAITAFLGLSIAGTLLSAQVIASLNNLFYMGISQFLAGLIAAAFLSRASAGGVISGIALGAATAFSLRLWWSDAMDINPGWAGLTVNFLAILVQSRLFPRKGGRHTGLFTPEADRAGAD